MMQLCGEWWYWEVCALVVGYLGPEPLAAHVAAINVISVAFMPVGGEEMGFSFPALSKCWKC